MSSRMWIKSWLSGNQPINWQSENTLLFRVKKTFTLRFDYLIPHGMKRVLRSPSNLGPLSNLVL